MVKGIIIVAFMFFMMILMMTRKCPTLLALIFLVCGISLIAGIPLKGTGNFFSEILTNGATNMASSYAVVFIGSWLGAALNKTGVSENIIRKTAELGGDKTLVVSLLLFGVSIFVYANMSGLGSVIMVATIIIPILISVGVDKLTAGCIMLLVVGTGNQIGASRPTFIANALGMTFDEVYPYSLVCAACTAAAAVVFIIVRCRKGGKKYAFSAPAATEEKPELTGVRGILAMLTPFIVVLLIALPVLKVPVIPAFLAGLAWLFIFTAKSWKQISNLAINTCYEGFSLGAPSASLMLFIGMLIKTIGHANVSSLLVPITNMITPTTMIAFILFFGLLAPLALYRGPLTLYGLGAGIGKLMVEGALLSPMLVAVGFMSNGCMLTTSCPTNSHSVWVAGFVEEDPGTILKNLMPYTWVASIVALVIGAVQYWA